MRPFFKDLPKGAAATVVALVLVATLSLGREEEAQAPPSAAIPAASTSERSGKVADELDIAKLDRRAADREFGDLFGAPIHASPPPKVAPAKPAPALEREVTLAPAAPPFPYSYLGEMKNGDRTIVYLLKNDEMFTVESGETVGDYRVENITETAIHFVYTPLGTPQTLDIPPSPAQ